MKSFYDKDDYTIDDLQLLIDNQVEESIYLDFKSSGSLEKSDKKRSELSKDVAAFANSDGGIIVYGIKEVNHVASEFSFIDGDEFTKEWIETIINSYVQRRISDVKIYPIRVDGNIKKSLYVVKIPYSYDAPHQSKDNRYYKRYNFMSVPMEEYEVRQSYNRKDKTDLIIDNVLIHIGSSIVQGANYLRSLNLALVFQVTNVSNSIEQMYKIEVHINRKILASGNPPNFMRNEDETAIFSFPNTSPLFQDEVTSIATIPLLFNSSNRTLLWEPVDVYLYYTNGLKTKTFFINKKMDLKGKPLEEWLWH
ncbi:MAG: ATP-binding protein [Pedobacter sp.]|nr:MAG: ATP-binding protein [Pedobacter sp.]